MKLVYLTPVVLGSTAALIPILLLSGQTILSLSYRDSQSIVVACTSTTCSGVDTLLGLTTWSIALAGISITNPAYLPLDSMGLLYGLGTNRKLVTYNPYDIILGVTVDNTFTTTQDLRSASASQDKKMIAYLSGSTV